MKYFYPNMFSVLVALFSTLKPLCLLFSVCNKDIKSCLFLKHALLHHIYLLLLNLLLHQHAYHCQTPPEATDGNLHSA